MDHRTVATCEFRERLGYRQYDVILTKEQSAVTKVMASFEGEDIETQLYVLGPEINSSFHDYNLAVEVDQSGIWSQ